MREILLADDEIHICSGIRELLADCEDRYHLVAEAGTGAEALQLFRRFVPDIVILDVRMPGMTGLEAFVKMREISAHVQGIFISAHSDLQYLRTAIQNEAVDYLFKPLDPTEILRALDRANARLLRLGIPETDITASESREAVNRKTAEEIRQYIRANYANPLTVRQIAEAVHLSAAYACTLYKRVTGNTILETLTETRMKTACRLLTETSLPVATIAQRVGYQDVRYFRQLFQKYAEQSPAEYRSGQEKKP